LGPYCKLKGPRSTCSYHNWLCGAWERSPAIFRGPETTLPRVPPYFNHWTITRWLTRGTIDRCPATRCPRMSSAISFTRILEFHQKNYESHCHYMCFLRQACGHCASSERTKSPGEEMRRTVGAVVAAGALCAIIATSIFIMNRSVQRPANESFTPRTTERAERLYRGLLHSFAVTHCRSNTPFTRYNWLPSRLSNRVVQPV